MNIIIIENEIYLAQSIAAKLADLGHHCDIFSSTKDAINENFYDVVLLSTNINSQDIDSIIEHYKESVVILMVSYISNETVSKPLQAGAKDYILKPFMIEELIRKIEHYQDYERIRKLNKTYKEYLDYSFNNIEFQEDLDDVELPLYISCNYQKYADAFAFKYAMTQNISLEFLSLNDPKIISKIKQSDKNKLMYISDFDSLKKADHESFFEIIKDKKVIISATDTLENGPIKSINFKNDNYHFEQGDILPIEDYVKYVLLNYQYKFPDTELSKKLGISRKSLWEKRKKYGIIKKK